MNVDATGVRRPRVLLVHPGTQHAPRLAAELEREGLLLRFWTGWARSGERFRGSKRWVDVSGSKLRRVPWVEWAALLLSRTRIPKEHLWHWRNGLFQRMVPRREIESADVVIGFDTASWILGERARAAGKRFVLDQSVAHPLSRAATVRAAGGDEGLWPEAFKPRLGPVRRAEAQEHLLADAVVVASSFAKRTLMENAVPEGKIRVIPYGVGEEFFRAPGPSGAECRDGRLFRFLYAGYLSRRKGVGVLLQAWCRCETRGAELVLAGGGGWGELPPNVRLLGQLSREALRSEMARSDVFVFPSLFEGFGLVLLEAMASGLPVITTPNTAGPDLLGDEPAGMIVPAGDADSLATTMGRFLSNPGLARPMGGTAMEVARTYTWRRYAADYAALLASLCEPRG